MIIDVLLHGYAELIINVGKQKIMMLDMIIDFTEIFVTGPGKTGLIYTKHTCSYYGTYLLFCMSYPKSVSFIEFLMDFCIYDDILDTLWSTDKSYYILNSQNQVKFYV